MQIPLGPGQRLAPEIVQNRVITTDPNLLNRGAQAVAGAVHGIASDVLNEKRREDDALAKVKASNALLDYESQLETGVTELGGKLKTLEIQPDHGDSAYQEFVSKLQPVQVEGLGPDDEAQLNLAMRKMQESKRQQLQGVVSEARTGVARSELRARFDLLENSAARPDADLGTILNRARAEGVQAVGRGAYGVDGWDNEMRTFEQGVYSANALARIHSAENDSVQLLQVQSDLMNWEGGPYADLTVKNRASLMKTLHPLLDRSIGVTAGQEAFQLATTPGGKLFSAMIQAESGGHQLTADGKPLKSARGATGIAQVMPETGPEAAKAAGLPWDEERFKTDANYNRALGEAYFGKLQQTFEGSDALAVVAYNAGPGRVQEWVEKIGDPRTGEISEADFIARIPYKETREYAQKVLNSAQRAAQPTFGPIAQSIDARTDLTPDQKRIATADARSRFEMQEQQIKQENLQRQEQAWDFVVREGNWQEIDPAVWSKLPAKERKELMNYRQNRETDPEVYTHTRDLIVNGNEVNLLDIRNKLSNTDFTRLTDLQIKRKVEGPGATSSIYTSKTMFSDALRNAGINSSPKPGSKDAKTLALAHRYLDDQVRDLEAQTGKKAAPEQVQQLVDRMFIKGEVEIPGWNPERFSFQTAPGEVLIVTDIEQIPAGERKEIEDALKRSGRKATEDEVLNLFNEGNQ